MFCHDCCSVARLVFTAAETGLHQTKFKSGPGRGPAQAPNLATYQLNQKSENTTPGTPHGVPCRRLVQWLGPELALSEMRCEPIRPMHVVMKLEITPVDTRNLAGHTDVHGGHDPAIPAPRSTADG